MKFHFVLAVVASILPFAAVADANIFDVTPRHFTSRTGVVGPVALFLAISMYTITGINIQMTLSAQYEPRDMMVPAETNTSDDNDVLPTWFKEYVISHREQRLALNETNWKDQRFLIMRCLTTDEGEGKGGHKFVCGGASDRLQSVPAMVMLANMTGRMLFIKWSKPAPLQEFLVPPTGGLDWTIPDWLDLHLDFQKLPVFAGINTGFAIKQAASSVQIMTFRRPMLTNGVTFYNEHKSTNDLEFKLVARDFWDTLFTPSPPVAALIRQNMNDLHLVPGEYVAVHVRSLYTSDASDNTDMIRNGINCATKLKPGWPVYFASDSSKAT